MEGGENSVNDEGKLWIANKIEGCNRYWKLKEKERKLREECTIRSKKIKEER